MYNKKPPVITIRLGRQTPGDTEIPDSYISEAEAEDTAAARLESHFTKLKEHGPPHTAWLFADDGTQLAQFRVGVDGKAIKVRDA